MKTTTVERYDPTLDQWVEMASLLSVRVGCAAGVLDGYIYVTGGYDGTKCLNSVERYHAHYTSPSDFCCPLNPRFSSRRRVLSFQFRHSLVSCNNALSFAHPIPHRFLWDGVLAISCFFYYQ